MSMMGYFGGTVAEASVDARLGFLRRTYLHVTGAFGLFIALSTLMYTSGASEAMLRAIAGSRFGVLALLGGVMVLGWLAQAMTRSEVGLGVQYAGLAGYTLLEAVIFAPLIFLAAKFAPEALPSAAIVTLLTFGGLTAYVLLTNKDFTFMGPILFAAGFIAVGTILCGIIFGFELGIWFSALMIAFAVGAILYTTSKVLHIYRTDQHVAAATEIFAAVAMLFYYVLRLFMQMRR